MITYLVLGVTVCLCSFSKGSPLRDDSLTLQSERIKSETVSRANNPLRSQPFQGRDNAALLVDQTSGIQLAGYIPSLNYSRLVDFYLFHRINDDIQVTKLPVDAKEIANAGFKKSYETKIVIHGFANDFQSEFTQQISRGYASDFDYNVIAVDWGKITYDMIYPSARYHVEGVGEYVGQFLATLYNASLIQPSGLHLIGHSLGAHVAGFAGKTVQKDGWRVARITGLDPAGVLFSDPNQRLTKTDADLLDVIHTCMKFLGIAANMGHIDFYPNGGTAIQPGCNFDLTGMCSHGRSHEFFVESIKRPEAFVGQLCENGDQVNNCVSETTAFMGAWLKYTREGAYYLKTSNTSPFGLNGNFVLGYKNNTVPYVYDVAYSSMSVEIL